MGNRLRGKTGIVTGAGSGIGRGIARLFAEESCSMVLVEQDRVRGELTTGEILQSGARCQLVVGDVSASEACQAAVTAALGMSERIDLLVNNAGIITRGSILETEPDVWDRLMAVNLRSVFLMSRAVLPHMPLGSAVINIASGWGLTGGEKAAAYCASKGGVVQLSRAMALDHGRQGVRVNCVCPGDIDTSLLRQEAEELKRPWPEFVRDAAERPLARIGTPLDIARACLFLASEEASYITGSVLVVDGGGLAGSLS